MEAPVSFPSDAGRLHGLLHEIPGADAVVITHPHPLYGGEMTNPVVESMAFAFQARGYTTLRFNFRGVGKSEGRFDNGPGEERDLDHAITYLRENGAASVSLAGYSFGAWIIARYLRTDRDISRVVMVSPPVAFMAFPAANPIPGLKLVVTGDADEFAPPAELAATVPVWNPKASFEVLANTDHFYIGALDELKARIKAELSD